MFTLKQYKRKIKSARNISKITKAMEMTAASKMKRAQDQALAGREYAAGISDLVTFLSGRIDPLLHPLLNPKKVESRQEIIILIAPEKGLCGSLVSNLTRFLLQKYSTFNDIQFITIGRKAKETINRIGGKILADFSFGFSQPKYDSVIPISRLIKDNFLLSNTGKVSVIYTNFINTMIQLPAQKLLLPIQLLELLPETTSKPNPCLFEPSSEQITQSLLEIYLELEIYQLLLESYASEQSARMVAMKNATDNAQELTKELTIGYNKARQSAITGEIIDIQTALTAI